MIRYCHLFVLQSEGEIVPAEVKSTDTKSRSLGVYRDKYNPRVSVRTSMANMKKEEASLNIPLCMLWMLDKWMKEK